MQYKLLFIYTTSFLLLDNQRRYLLNFGLDAGKIYSTFGLIELWYMFIYKWT